MVTANVEKEKEIRQFIGYLYEAFFKYGFGTVKKENLEAFFSGGKEDATKVLRESRGLKDLVFGYINDERNTRGSLKVGEKNWIMDYIINLALTQGRYYRNFIQIQFGEREDVKGDLYEHGKGGYYKNADIMFIAKNRLFVVEIKTDRVFDILNDLSRIVQESQNCDVNYKNLIDYKVFIPIKLFMGTPIKLLAGRLTLKNFVDSFLSREDIFTTISYHNLETITTLQSLAYAVSFLEEEKERLNYINSIKIEVIHPFEKLYSPLVWIDEREKIDFDEVSERIKKLYQHVKGSKSDKTLQALYSKKDEDVKYVMLEIDEACKEIRERLQKRNGSIFRVEAKPISEVRSAVKDVVEDFVVRRKEDKGLKVLGLFHSAGSGKTTSIRNIANMEKNVLVIYFAPRKILVQRERDEYERLGFTVYMPEEQSRTEGTVSWENYRTIKNIAPRHNVIEEGISCGNLLLVKTFLDEFLQKIQENYNKIACLTTTQSIVDINKQGTNTLRHIIKTVNNYLKIGFRVYLILDEVFGDNGGLHAMLEIFRRLYNKPAYCFILDANVYSANLLQRVLRDYKEHKGHIQACLYALKFKEKHFFDYEEKSCGEKIEVKNIECYTEHGFITTHGSVNIVEHFIVIEKEDSHQKFLSEVYKIVKDVGEKSEFSVLVFMQNKELGWQLHRKLSEVGKSIALNTTFRSSEDEVNRQEEGRYLYKYIVSTSTASRGVSFRNVKDVVVVFTEHSIEENMVEIIQAISRGRGSQEIENQERYIHLVYKIDLAGLLKKLRNKSYYHILPDERKVYSDKYYEAVLYLETLKLADISRKMIQQFVNTPSRGQEVIIPVPTLSTSYYCASQLGGIIQILQLIRDIVITVEDESGSKEFTVGMKVRSLFSSAISMKVKNTDRQLYIHPFLFDAKMPYASIRIGKKEMNNAIQYTRKVLQEFTREKEDVRKKLESEISNLEKLINSSKGEALEIEEKFYVAIPTYTRVLMDYLKPGQAVKFALAGEIRDVETLGKIFSVVAESEKYVARNFSKPYKEPCIVLLDKEISGEYLEIFTHRVYPSFIYNLLNKEGECE